MRFARSSGILLPVTSLASRGGIGDLGPESNSFLEFLSAARQHIWQVLPLCPTGYGNSPYAGSSAFAGNPYLISLELLAEWGWMEPGLVSNKLDALPDAGGRVDFDAVETQKLPVLHEAAQNFLERGPNDPEMGQQWLLFADFCRDQQGWLEDYALYAVLRRTYQTGAWASWPEPVRRRDEPTLAALRAEHAPAVAIERVLQFAFDLQWRRLRAAANTDGIRILGDIAIFVSMDSADVWANPNLFQLDEDLQPVRVAGVPPDYFSPTGQRWGNPLYDWEAMRTSGYAWWIERLRRACEHFDLVRLDHFRGFEAFWSIPADEETAVNGEWVKAPGRELFRHLESALGPLPLIAEDLGVITPEVDALRQEFAMPGMRVMQFGFSSVEAHNHLPHRFDAQTVAYTGTHDNDTTPGWWAQAGAEERAAAEHYIGPVGDNGAWATWGLMRALHASVASLTIVPAQDVLGLGSEARMNTPAVAEGNWSWRAGPWRLPEMVGLAQGLEGLALVMDRDNDPLSELVLEDDPENCDTDRKHTLR